MTSSTKSLTVLLLACILNRAQFYGECYSVMPFLATNSSMLDDVSVGQVNYLEVTSLFSFFLAAFLPIPLVRHKQGLLVDCFKDLKLLIVLALTTSSLISFLIATTSNTSIFFGCQLSNAIVSSILFPAVVKHLSVIWNRNYHGLIFSCLAVQAPIGYVLASLTHELSLLLK
jgi:sugar phosphate permease